MPSSLTSTAGSAPKTSRERRARLVLGSIAAVALAACGGGETMMPKPTPEGCEAAIAANDPATIQGDTKGAPNLDEGSCITGKGVEVRYEVVPAQTGMLDLTLDAEVDLGMYVRSVCADTKSEIGCADDGVEGATEALSVPVT